MSELTREQLGDLMTTAQLGSVEKRNKALADIRAMFEAVTKERDEAKCGEVLCGHDHSAQYWELRANKAENQATDAQEAIGHYQAEVHQLQQQLAAVTKERDDLIASIMGAFDAKAEEFKHGRRL